MMQRKLRLCLENIEETSDGYQNISIYNMDKIVNDSCDLISIDTLEFLDAQQSEKLLIDAIRKLRSGGYINLSFANIKKLCYQYNASMIDGTSLYSALKNKNHIVDIHWLNNIIKQYNCNIINMIESDHKISLSIQRA
jgi:hypothetical protein